MDEVTTEFQRHFHTLENTFVKTLSDEMKFLKRQLRKKIGLFPTSQVKIYHTL